MMLFVEALIGAFVAFMLGFAWYTALFGKAWQTESGVTDEQAQSGMAMTHGLAFLMMIVISYALSFLMNVLHPIEEQTFLHGATHGLMLAGLIGIPAIAINYLYQRKSLKLFLIDASYILLWMAASGAVISALKLYKPVVIG